MNYQITKDLLKKKLKSERSEAAYTLNLSLFENEYELLLSSFREYYDKANIAYSFKTNYIPNFLNIVKEKGGYAEVVSIMELKLALKVGFLPQDIFFNGPFKHQEETEKYLELGVLVNIDSYDEFKWIEAFANKNQKLCRIGLRLNFNLNNNPSRFGIDIEDEVIEKILKSSRSSNFLSLESLHYHYASRELTIWKTCKEKFLYFLSELDSVTCKNLKYISLGGGMFSRMDPFLEQQLPFEIPSFNEYADSSIKYFPQFFKKNDYFNSINPIILIEPGTALASKSLDFVVEVISIKTVNNITYINTTGSKYNMNPSPNRINSPTEVLNFDPDNSIEVNNAKLCGYTCIESDVIHDNFSGKISIGDLIVFKEVGSYSVVMKPPFILPDVAILQYDDKKNKFDTIRNRQTFEDIFTNFNFFKN